MAAHPLPAAYTVGPMSDDALIGMVEIAGARERFREWAG